MLRQPEIGDVGTVVDIPETNSQEKIFTIECVVKGGYTAWLADFSEDDFLTQSVEIPVPVGNNHTYK